METSTSMAHPAGPGGASAQAEAQGEPHSAYPPADPRRSRRGLTSARGVDAALGAGALGLAVAAASPALAAAGLVHLAAASPDALLRPSLARASAFLTASLTVAGLAVAGLAAGAVPDPAPVAAFALLGLAVASLRRASSRGPHRRMGMALLAVAGLGALTGSSGPDFLLALNLAALLAADAGERARQAWAPAFQPRGHRVRLHRSAPSLRENLQ